MNWINNWYFFLLIISIIINIIPSKIITKYDSYIFVLLILFTINAITCRPLTFNDDDNYLSMLQDFKFLNVHELGKISSLFYYLNLVILRLSNNVEIVLKINFILIWIIILMSFFFENVKNKTFYYTFLLMLFQVLFFIQLRNAFAIIFLNWGLIRYNKNKSGILFFIFSILFHYSVLPFIIIFFLTKKYFKPNHHFEIKRNIFNLIIAFVVSYFFFTIYNRYIVVLPFFEKYFIDFINTPEVGNTSILQIMLLVLHIFFFMRLDNNNTLINRSIYIIYFGLLLAIVFFTLPLFQRIIVPFYLFSITTFIYVLKLYSKKYFNIYYILIILIYFMISINRSSYFENWHIL